MGPKAGDCTTVVPPPDHEKQTMRKGPAPHRRALYSSFEDESQLLTVKSAVNVWRPFEPRMVTDSSLLPLPSWELS